jgi:hypothetical protein
MTAPIVVVTASRAPVRVVTRAPAVAVVASGPQGPAGPPGAALDYEHVQSAASAEWIVNHNLGVEPAVSVLSAGGVEVLAQIVHVSVNQFRVYFASPQAGRARCL